MQEGDQEEGGDSGGFDACWLDADGHIGMVKLGTTKRGRCFFHTGGGARQQRQEGLGCEPAAQFPCYLSHCFFPPAHNPAGGGTAQKSWHSVKSRNLASSQGSDTFDKLLHNTLVI